MEEIFNEKYRPKEFSEVVGLDPEIPNIIKDGNIPHMLFVGPAGTGKTTTAKIIIDKLGADTLVLNASKERGIDTIRERIEPFAKKASDRLKIVFFDEFDATTPQFQTALRNFMEVYSNSTRFIATCNYPNKIIEPLISRFSVYTFQKYNLEEKKNRIKEIIKAENIKIDEESIDYLCQKYKDDIRGIINFLNRNRFKDIKKADISKENLILNILSKLKNKEWFNLRQELLAQNLDYNYLIEEMDTIIFKSRNIPLNVKKKANILFSKYAFEMNFSFNKEICFSALLAELEDVLQEF